MRHNGTTKNTIFKGALHITFGFKTLDFLGKLKLEDENKDEINSFSI
jgi:hypothetical protein